MIWNNNAVDSDYCIEFALFSLWFALVLLLILLLRRGRACSGTAVAAVLLSQVQKVGQMKNGHNARHVIRHILFLHRFQLSRYGVVHPVGSFARQLADRLDGMEDFVLVGRYWCCKLQYFSIIRRQRKFPYTLLMSISFFINASNWRRKKNYQALVPRPQRVGNSDREVYWRGRWYCRRLGRPKLRNACWESRWP